MKTIDNAIDKYMDEDKQGNACQIITILPIWRDPHPDIGLNPRNNWCMQSQIGSQPKIWAHYFIRWSHILCAKIICVSNTEIQILLVPIMAGVFKSYPRQCDLQIETQATFTCRAWVKMSGPQTVVFVLVELNEMVGLRACTSIRRRVHICLSVI